MCYYQLAPDNSVCNDGNNRTVSDRLRAIGRVFTKCAFRLCAGRMRGHGSLRERDVSHHAVPRHAHVLPGHVQCKPAAGRHG